MVCKVEVVIIMVIIIRIMLIGGDFIGRLNFRVRMVSLSLLYKLILIFFWWILKNIVLSIMIIFS